jgi:benzoyl-CoA 2,3-epoxidase subunit B
VQAGVERWNKVIEKSGIPFRLRLPHKGFHRQIGNFAGHHISPDGEVMTAAAWKAKRDEWMPSAADYTFVQAMMSGRVVEPGKFANWIAPPRRGIHTQAIDFEYVRFN